MKAEYDFKTTPYTHQAKIFELSRSEEWYALFLEMGTGKTKIVIDTMAFLFERKEIDTALIIAPKGVYDNWVMQEIPLHMPDRIPARVVRWQPSFTKVFRSEISDIAVPENREAGTLSILVMNIEALSTQKGGQTAKRYLELNPDNILIVDESTTIKNRKAARTKRALDLSEVAKYRRILTGSPITKSPLDLFSQCNFLSPKALDFKSYYSFQARYAKLLTRKMGHRSFQQIIGYQNLEELGQKLDKFSSRILKKDCLDLPEKIYMQRLVPMTKEQHRVYAEMKQFALAQLYQGKLATTASILTQLMRLQQITCGFIAPDEGELQVLKNNRLDELLNILEEVDGKALIWSTFTHNIHEIKEAIALRHGPDSVAVYYGGTPQDMRQKIVTDFQDPDSPLRFFVGQPRTGGFGLTLTAATTVIYYNNSYDLETRLQSEDRPHRIGQDESVTYIDLISPRTIDEKILKALRSKINIAGKILGEEFKTWLL